MEQLGIEPLPLSEYDITDLELGCGGDISNLMGFQTEAKAFTKEIMLKKG